MPTDHFVAIDLSTDAGRAVLAGLSGDRLTIETRHRFSTPIGRMNGQFQWNLLAIWEEIKTGIRRCAIDRAGQKASIDAVAIDAWGSDFGLLSPSGDVLGNPIHHRDPRTDGVMDKVFQRVARQHVFDLTGVRASQGTTLLQLVALQQSGSSLLSAAETLLFVPDLLNYLITGKKQSEPTIAASSQLYNPRKRGWAEDLLGELELPRKIMPTVAAIASVIGAVRKDVAAECRINAVPVIATASHESAAAATAAPAEGDGWCYIILAASSSIGIELSAPMINQNVLRAELSNELSPGGRSRLVQSIGGMWLAQDCRRQFRLQGQDVSAPELEKLAAEAPALQTVIDPDHQPFRVAGDMPKKIERFAAATQQRPPTAIGHFIRTCLESVAMNCRRALAGLEEVSGRRIKTIHAIGEQSRSALLCQMIADACARPVLAGPAEAAAIGNALVQAMAMGSIRSIEDGRAIVRRSFEIKRYEPRETKAWDTAYERYLEIRQHR